MQSALFLSKPSKPYAYILQHYAIASVRALRPLIDGGPRMPKNIKDQHMEVEGTAIVKMGHQDGAQSCMQELQAQVASLQAELQQMHQIITISNRLAAELDITQAMDAVRQVALELLDCEKVTLFLVFGRSRELRAQLGSREGVPRDFIIRVRFGEGIAGTVAQTGGFVNIPDAYAHPLFNGAVDRVTGFRTRNVLSCAIPDMTGRNVAVLQALNKNAGASFTPADEKSLRLISQHLGNTLAKARLHEVAKREKARLSALYKTFKALNAAEDLDAVLELVAAALHDVLHAEFAFVFVVDSPRKELWTTFRTPSSQEPLMARVRMGEGVVGEAAASRVPCVLAADNEGAACSSPSGSRGPTSPGSSSAAPGASNQSGAPLLDETLLRQIGPALTGTHVRSVLAQPLMGSDEKVVGVILAINKREVGSEHDIFFENYYTEADMDAMALFSLEVGQSLSDRALECALASAMSVVGYNAAAAAGEDGWGSVDGGSEDGAGVVPDVAAENELLLRSQLMSMYYQNAPEYKRVASDASAMSQHALPGSCGPTRRWQRTLTKLVNFNCTSSLRRRKSQDSGGVDSGPSFMGRSRSTIPTSCQQPHVDLSLQIAHPSLTGHLPLSLTALGSELDQSGGSGTTDPDGGHAGMGLPLMPVHGAAARVRPGLVGGSSPQLGAGWEQQGRGYGSTGSMGSGFMAAGVGQQEQQGNQVPRAPRLRAMLGSVAERVRGGSSRDVGRARQEAVVQGGGTTNGHREVGGGSSAVQVLDALVALSAAEDRRVVGKTSGRHGANEGATGSRATRGGSGPRQSGGGGGSGGDEEDEDAASFGSSGTGSLLPQELVESLSRVASAKQLHSGLTPRSSQGAGTLSGEHSVHSQVSHSSHLRHSGVGGTIQAIQLQGENEPPSSGSSGSRHGTPRGGLVSGSGTATFFCPEAIGSWAFDFTNMVADDLVKLCYDMFALSGLMDHFGLSMRTLSSFISAVSSHYHSIPYHNFNHVVHVTHGVWMMLRTSCAKDMLAPEDRLALMIAALCHDLDHDGYSNSYHVNTQSELARIYNDVSVMENHHCAMTFALLRRKDCALLEELAPDTRRRMRKTIVSAILCTDMSNHFVLTSDFKKHPVQYDPESDADRLLLLKVLLHAADIGNAVRPFAINDAMSKRVHREFQAQAQEEARLGLPVTFSVDSSNPRMCAQVEANFLDYVVTPLWERLVEVLPELAPCLTTLTANRQLYGELASRGSFASPSMARAPRSSSSVAVVLPREGAQTGSAPSSLTAAPLNGAPVDGVAPRPSDGA